MDDVAAAVLGKISQARIVPVLRMDSASEIEAAALRLVEGGVRLIEIAATSPGWLDALDSLSSKFDEVTFGVGTIVTASDAKSALDSGAEFLVSPYSAPAVRSVAGGHLIEGGFTPGEIAAAAEFGLAKLFPAHAVGPSYLQSLLAVLPGASVMPTGGLSIDVAVDWLRAGAVAVGVGAALSDHPEPSNAIAEVVAKVDSSPV